MTTIIKDWFTVTLIDDVDERKKLYDFIWGIVVFDDQERYEPESFVCTSKILSIDKDNNHVITITGEHYELEGKGCHVNVPRSKFLDLYSGLSPLEI